MIDKPAPDYLWALFQQLRRRHFPLGTDDYEALWQALRAGIGWSSREALRDLCCALWAKSQRETEIVEALFDQFEVPTWQLPKLESQLVDASQSASELAPDDQPPDSPKAGTSELMPTTVAHGGLPPITLDGVQLPEYHFVFVPQFPLTYREVAQAWRRLRQPVREGPRTELNVEATINRRSRLGLVSEVVLIPRRRNTARLLLLVDRQGSMTPFHHFVDEVCTAIQEAGNLENVALYYFHDVPVEGADETILAALSGQLFPTLDPVLSEVTPLTQGFLYNDPHLLSSQALIEILETHATKATVVILSDAGAARGRYDPLRMLDTAAFIKGLKNYTSQYVWLNPLPQSYWANTTAAQIARHLPMFPLSQAGMYHAVNVLRGQLYSIERPI